MSSSDSSSYSISSSEEESRDVNAEAQNITQNLVPKKSILKYRLCYENFMKWRKENKIHDLTENVILIFRFCGAMRSGEYCELNKNDVEDDTKNHYPRTFVVTAQYYNKAKKKSKTAQFITERDPIASTSKSHDESVASNLTSLSDGCDIDIDDFDIENLPKGNPLFQTESTDVREDNLGSQNAMSSKKLLMRNKIGENDNQESLDGLTMTSPIIKIKKCKIMNVTINYSK
ncbi:hypothetical protein KQX54_012109 [Cotesia glomerata]|uniref:Uncharacterized protein n=1 Tax=Cotesia glomerata TaxID=32391 RepID=A0AAV7HT45_COTGL|nr:hypothetical protein KQX54_012109 [Cotesia glomerata]